jgi:hypothetical protein
MTTSVTQFKHMPASHAIALVKAIDGVNSADQLCHAAIAYPNAIAISKMITAGVGDVGALHRMGYSGSDAIALAAAITAAGAH